MDLLLVITLVGEGSLADEQPVALLIGELAQSADPLLQDLDLDVVDGEALLDGLEGSLEVVLAFQILAPFLLEKAHYFKYLSVLLRLALLLGQQPQSELALLKSFIEFSN